MIYYPKKRLGQHFLTDPNTLKKIVKTINPKPSETIIEIGSGKGALTKLLLDSGASIHAIEIDRHLLPILKEKFSKMPNFHLHHTDALTFNIMALIKNSNKIRVAGNIPYNITSPLLFWVYDNSKYIKDVHFLIQREVAQRITSQPGNKDYGILSVLSHFYGSLKLEFTVSSKVFRPIPEVRSSLISMQIKPHNENEILQEKLKITVKAAFNKRRKTLLNSLAELIPRTKINSPIDLQRRAETLNVEEFIALAQWIFGL